MKKIGRKVIGWMLSLIVVSGVVLSPTGIQVSAQDEMDNLTKLLGEEWNVYNSNVDSSVKTEEFLNIVEDQANIGHYALRIGHETEATKLYLNLVLPVDKEKADSAELYKYEVSVYKRGTEFNTVKATIMDGDRNGLGGSNICEAVLTDLKAAENAWYTIANESSKNDLGNGRPAAQVWANENPLEDKIRLTFYVDCEAGSYLYIDDVKMAVNYYSSSSDIYTAGKDITEGDTIIFTDSFERWACVWNENSATFSDDEFICVTEEEKNTGNKSLRIGSEKSDTNVTLEMIVPVSNAGTYEYNTYIKTKGVISDGSKMYNWYQDKWNTSCSIGGEYSEWTQINKANGYSTESWIDPGYMRLQIQVKCEQGNYLYIDDFTAFASDDVTKKNYVFDSSFENYQVDTNIEEDEDDKSDNTEVATAPEKLADGAREWQVWTSDSDKAELFVAKGGYESDSSFAFGNTKEGSQSITQSITGLENGTYVFSAWVKSSGGQEGAAIVVKGHDSTDAKIQKATSIMKADTWTYVSVEVEVTSGKADVSIWNKATEGQWLVVDNVEFYNKSNPSINLVKNGQFSDYYKTSASVLPPRAEISVSGNNDNFVAPATGDNHQLVLWMLVVALSMIALVVSPKLKRV